MAQSELIAISRFVKVSEWGFGLGQDFKYGEVAQGVIQWLEQFLILMSKRVSETGQRFESVLLHKTREK